MKYIYCSNSGRELSGISSALSTGDNQHYQCDPSGNDLYNAIRNMEPDIVLLPESINAYNLCKQFLNTKFIIIHHHEINVKIDNLFYYYVAPAANTLFYGTYNKSPSLSSDIICIDTHSPLFDLQYLYNVLYLNSEYKVKLFGMRKIHIPQYLGNISIDSEAKLLASAKLCVAFDLHTVYNATVSGVCCIAGFQNIFVPYFNSQKEFKELLKYLTQPTIRDKLVQTALTEIKKNHTYVNRAIDLLHFVGMEEIAGELS